MRTKAWLGALILALAAGAWGAESAGPYFKNERWGYKVRAPDGWTAAAMGATEEWIAGKHIGKRSLQPKNGAWSERPEMWVVGFPHARLEDRGAKVEKEGDTTTITIKNPYKDYKDFLKRERWFVGGGYFFSQEEEGELEGMKVSMYEVTVDKMVDSPFRMVAWVYHADDVDFAVQFRILADHYDSHKAAFLGCLKSFRRIPRTAAIPGSAQTGDEKIVSIEDESKLPAEERSKRRRESADRAIAKEIEALPQGWFTLENEQYVALSNADRKFTQTVLDHATAIRAYLDKTFTGIGGDFVPRGVIRVFATDPERIAFLQTTRSFWGGIRQVLVSRATGQEKSWELESVSEDITHQWFSFKNRSLAYNMPYWISDGLARYMKFARSKGKRLEFKPDDYDRQWIKELIKKGNAVPVRKLLEGDEKVFEAPGNQGLQSGSVVQFLIERANRGATKDCVRTYLAALVTAVEAAEAEFKAFRDKQLEEAKQRAAESGAPGASEGDADDDEGEDGEKQWKEFEEALKKKAKAIRETAFRQAFGALSDSDWQRLDTQWREFAG